MPITVSSRELNQDIGRAKRAALTEPVFITDRGKPAHVLLSIDEYQRLLGSPRSLTQTLAMPGLTDIDLEMPKARITSAPAELE